MKTISNFLMPNGGSYRIDILSGLTVALALIPEAIAFSLVAHVSPLVGLFSAFFLCLITAILGGRPGMISGATGSMAVVIVSLVSVYGVQYLFPTIILTGILQILFGVFRFAKFIRMMPKSVMVGFVNGLAITIFVAQLHQFQVIHLDGSRTWLTGTGLWIMIGLVIVAMGITHYLPRLTKAVPAALTAIIVVTCIVYFTGLHTRVVSDMMIGHEVTHALPHFALPHVPWDWNTVKIVVPYALILTIVALSETLLTLSLIDEITQTHGKASREAIAQGIANVVAGFFKGMGGCAMIGQSMINIGSGARGRLSGIVAGVFLFLFVVIFWPLIKMIPLAALTGVMFIVVIETFEWATFKFIRKIPLHDALIIVVVTLVTVATDLAVAVVVGIILASLIFAWQTAKKVHISVHVDNEKLKEYRVYGPLFFGSSAHFKTLFSPGTDPDDVVIDFQNSRVADHSAIDAIKFVATRYDGFGKRLHLKHLSPECKALLGKAGKMVEVNVLEDPDYHVASDQLD